MSRMRFGIVAMVVAVPMLIVGSLLLVGENSVQVANPAAKGRMPGTLRFDARPPPASRPPLVRNPQPAPGS